MRAITVITRVNRFRTLSALALVLAIPGRSGRPRRVNRSITTRTPNSTPGSSVGSPTRCPTSRQHLSTRRARAGVVRAADRLGVGRRARALAGRLRGVDVQPVADRRTGGDGVRRLVRDRSPDRNVEDRNGRRLAAGLQHPSLDPAAALCTSNNSAPKRRGCWLNSPANRASS
jgi:hypothetical protein